MFQVGMLIGRMTCSAVFGASTTLWHGADEIVVVYDVKLQHGPPGFIKCLYLILRRLVTNKRYLDLSIEQSDDIIRAIET